MDPLMQSTNELIILWMIFQDEFTHISHNF